MYGLDIVLHDFGYELMDGWLPHYGIFSSNLFTYPSFFREYPDIPIIAPGLITLLKSYTASPFAYTDNISLLWWSPLAMLASMVSLVVLVHHLFLAKGGSEKLWAWVLVFLFSAYTLKLATYPFLYPPKSEIFHIIPMFLVVGVTVARLNKNQLRAIIAVLLVVSASNAIQLSGPFVANIRKYSGASKRAVATYHRQVWYNDALEEGDVVFGRALNECTYIEPAECIPFIWQSLFFVEWDVVQDRVQEIEPTVIYDSSPHPDSIFPFSLELIERRFPSIHEELGSIDSRYRMNYLAKEIFLETNYEFVTNDTYGNLYRLVTD